MEHYYLQITESPKTGMMYLDNGQYFYPVYYKMAYGEPNENAEKCSKDYLIKVESAYTITADTDGGCDRTCEATEYIELTAENVLIKDNAPIGFYLDLGYYYSISSERPNVHVFYIPETQPFNHCSGAVYTLIHKEQGKEYKASYHTY